MAIDRMFSRIARSSERDLYRQTFRVARQSQRKMLSDIISGKKAMRKRNFAKEVVWFLFAAVAAFIFGFVFFFILAQWAPELMLDMVYELGNLTLVYFVFSGFSFLGIYIIRLMFWAIETNSRT